MKAENLNSKHSNNKRQTDKLKADRKQKNERNRKRAKGSDRKRRLNSVAKRKHLTAAKALTEFPKARPWTLSAEEENDKEEDEVEEEVQKVDGNNGKWSSGNPFAVD